MSIYNRFGEEVTIVRMGTLKDVESLDGRKADSDDRIAVKNGSYVVVKTSDGKLQLMHQAYMRATEGSVEISKALRALGSSS